MENKQLERSANSVIVEVKDVIERLLESIENLELDNYKLEEEIQDFKDRG